MKKTVKIISLIVIVLLSVSTVIYANNIAVSGLQVEKNYITLEIGQTEKIILIFTPFNATNKKVNWISDNSNIATVNANGEIKGISGGVVTVKGTTVDGGYTVSITVNVSGESSITSEKYSIIKKNNSLNEEVKYITKIDKKTNIDEFSKNISTYSILEYYNLENDKMGNLDYIFSGTRVRLVDNSEYVLVVTGDTNSNGDITASDLSRLKTRIIGLNTLDDYQEVAADMNHDGKITITDLSLLKRFLVGL